MFSYFSPRLTDLLAKSGVEVRMVSVLESWLRRPPKKIAPSRFAAVSRRVRTWSVEILLRLLADVADDKNCFFVFFCFKANPNHFSLVSGELSYENISGLSKKTIPQKKIGIPHKIRF